MPNGDNADNSKKYLLPVGVVASATGVGGFAFGVFAQLGLAGLLAQQSRFALTIFAAAAALILAAGRATLPIEGAKHWAVDGLITLFAVVTAIGVYLVFAGPAELDTFATFESSLAGNIDAPKLTPRVELGRGVNKILLGDDVPVRISADRGVTIRLENLESLLAKYSDDEQFRRSEADRFAEILRTQKSAEK